MATFFNQASFTLGTTVTNSNIAEGEILSGVEITKSAVNQSYSQGSSIVYTVNISGIGAGATDGITLTDDLGAYIPLGATDAVVPLDYVDGSLLYYQNGVLQPTPTVVSGPPLTISALSLPAGGNITLVYEARANAFAPLGAGECITNTATATVGGNESSASARVCAEERVNLSIAKAICPAVVSENGIITYTFIVQNTGNLEVLATDNASLADTFNPILSDISVTLNGEPLSEGVGYEYDEATGVFRTLDGAISIPAATFIRDTASGAVTVNPGVAVITVTGRV